MTLPDNTDKSWELYELLQANNQAGLEDLLRWSKSLVINVSLIEFMMQEDNKETVKILLAHLQKHKVSSCKHLHSNCHKHIIWMMKQNLFSQHLNAYFLLDCLKYDDYLILLIDCGYTIAIEDMLFVSFILQHCSNETPNHDFDRFLNVVVHAGKLQMFLNVYMDEMIPAHGHDTKLHWRIAQYVEEYKHLVANILMNYRLYGPHQVVLSMLGLA